MHHAFLIGRGFSDVDQSLMVIIGFLLLLFAGLVLAAYLEPGTQAKPLQLRERWPEWRFVRFRRRG